MRQLPFDLVRQAVCSGDFGSAQALWNESVASLAEELSTRRLTEARLSEVRELVEWSRTVVLCERAHLLDRLNSLHVAREYELPLPPRTPRLVSASF